MMAFAIPGNGAMTSVIGSTVRIAEPLPMTDSPPSHAGRTVGLDAINQQMATAFLPCAWDEFIQQVPGQARN
jgi:hypothetical protein